MSLYRFCYLLLLYRLRDHRVFGKNQFTSLLCNEPVLFLSCRITPDGPIVHPTTHRPVDVHPRGHQSLRKKGAGHFFSNAHIERSSICSETDSANRADKSVPNGSLCSTSKRKRVLSISVILKTAFSCSQQIIIRCVTTGELLERERTMSENLARDIARTLNEDTGIHHFKGRPVCVVDEVADQPRRSLSVVFIFGIRHPRHLGNKIVAIRGCPD